MNIAITGGHITPAIEFARFANKKGDILVCIGNQKPGSFEVDQISQLNIPYLHLSALKFDRHQKYKLFTSSPLLFSSVFKAIKLLKKHRINVVVGFGSYVAFPVSLAAWTLSIPVILHEQTRAPGIANRLIGKFATQCAVSYQETVSYFPKNKTVVTGNLIRQGIWQSPSTNPLQFSPKNPYVFITGGNLGASVLVNAATDLAPRFQNLTFVLQTGINQTINNAQTPNIYSQPWFSEAEMSWLLHHAHLIIARGGANTIAEIMVAGTPAIIVPLPHAANNEQTANGNILSAKHAGIVTSQTKELVDTLQNAITTIQSDYDTYAKNAKELKSNQNPDAARKLYQLIAAYQ
jgi:UDP-N-acetylglucosamine--N-acetylmuramyl-(pentapeptide) pyrophosphoryl-undecaprenol N-acetylglucosamine transferase